MLSLFYWVKILFINVIILFFSFCQPPSGDTEKNNILLLLGYKARKRRKRAVVYELYKDLQQIIVTE